MMSRRQDHLPSHGRVGLHFGSTPTYRPTYPTQGHGQTGQLACGEHNHPDGDQSPDPQTLMPTLQPRKTTSRPWTAQVHPAPVLSGRHPATGDVSNPLPSPQSSSSSPSSSSSESSWSRSPVIRRSHRSHRHRQHHHRHQTINIYTRTVMCTCVGLYVLGMIL